MTVSAFSASYDNSGSICKHDLPPLICGLGNNSKRLQTEMFEA